MVVELIKEVAEAQKEEQAKAEDPSTFFFYVVITARMHTKDD